MLPNTPVTIAYSIFLKHLLSFLLLLIIFCGSVF